MADLRHTAASGAASGMWDGGDNMLQLDTGPTVAPIPRGLIFLPSIHKDSEASVPTDQPLSLALRIFTLFRMHPMQQRKGIHWNDLLADVAYNRIVDMAQLGYYGHVDPWGYGANHDVREAGYKLPDWYHQGRDANNIESINAGSDTLSLIWNSWLDSAGHRPHVLGLHPFYEGQTEVGIAHYALPGSKYGNYFSLITCHPEG